MAFTRLFIASDHGGLTLKHYLVQELSTVLPLEDIGPDCAESCDYPLYARKVCDRILATPGSAGILVCGTGIGMSMAANRVSGIRAALCCNEYSARMARAHNDANVLCLGERVLGLGLALGIARLFLDTDFEAGRHARRIGMFDA